MKYVLEVQTERRWLGNPEWVPLCSYEEDHPALLWGSYRAAQGVYPRVRMRDALGERVLFDSGPMVLGGHARSSR